MAFKAKFGGKCAVTGASYRAGAMIEKVGRGYALVGASSNAAKTAVAGHGLSGRNWVRLTRTGKTDKWELSRIKFCGCCKERPNFDYDDPATYADCAFTAQNGELVCPVCGNTVHVFSEDEVWNQITLPKLHLTSDGVLSQEVGQDKWVLVSRFFYYNSYADLAELHEDMDNFDLAEQYDRMGKGGEWTLKDTADIATVENTLGILPENRRAALDIKEAEEKEARRIKAAQEKAEAEAEAARVAAFNKAERERFLQFAAVRLVGFVLLQDLTPLPGVENIQWSNLDEFTVNLPSSDIPAPVRFHNEGVWSETTVLGGQTVLRQKYKAWEHTRTNYYAAPETEAALVRRDFARLCEERSEPVAAASVLCAHAGQAAQDAERTADNEKRVAQGYKPLSHDIYNPALLRIASVVGVENLLPLAVQCAPFRVSEWYAHQLGGHIKGVEVVKDFCENAGIALSLLRRADYPVSTYGESDEVKARYAVGKLKDRELERRAVNAPPHRKMSIWLDEAGVEWVEPVEGAWEAVETLLAGPVVRSVPDFLFGDQLGVQREGILEARGFAGWSGSNHVMLHPDGSRTIEIRKYNRETKDVDSHILVLNGPTEYPHEPSLAQKEEAAAGEAQMKARKKRESEASQIKSLQKKFNRPALAKLLERKTLQKEERRGGRSGVESELQMVRLQMKDGTEETLWQLIETWWAMGEDGDAGDTIKIFDNEADAQVAYKTSVQTWLKGA